MGELSTERQRLALADRHIAEAMNHIALQRQIIDRLTMAGIATDSAEELLELLKKNLRQFERHRALIVDTFRSE